MSASYSCAVCYWPLWVKATDMEGTGILSVSVQPCEGPRHATAVLEAKARANLGEPA